MDWWTPQQAGMVGAILGSGIGVILGGIGGGVCGPLAGKGRARGFVIPFFYANGVIGILLVLSGLTALVTGQPYHVWYPLLLPGVIATRLVCVLLPVLRRVYHQHEGRRLAAEELRRG